jgi:biopolymer transport protein ExbB/TolQ
MNMTDPNKYAFRMLFLLLIVVFLIFFLFEPLKEAFEGNTILNSVIISTFILGAIFAFRQTFRLSNEAKWLKFIKKKNSLLPANIALKIKPVLLAPVASVLSEDRKDNPSLSANSLSTILDGVSSRLDESREILRYMIGLLVFLGLLGTFWGLLQTISSVSGVINTIDFNISNVPNEGTSLFMDIQKGLSAPLSGMSTAFSSSLFGLAASLILGFLDLQVGQASNRFFNELEDWLSQMAIFTTNETGNNGLSEAALENLVIVAKRANQNENEKIRINENISELTIVLNRLVEKLDEDRSVKDHLISISAILKSLGEQNIDKISEIQNNLTLELRAISKQLSKTEKSKNKFNDE